MLLLLAIKDRKWRLQVSRGLVADLPDGEAATKYAEALIKHLAPRRGFKKP